MYALLPFPEALLSNMTNKQKSSYLVICKIRHKFAHFTSAITKSVMLRYHNKAHIQEVILNFAKIPNRCVLPYEIDQWGKYIKKLCLLNLISQAL